MSEKDTDKPAAADSTPDDDLLERYAAGDFVFREGDEGTVTYIVESGQIEVLRRFGSRERRVALLGSGDFFGEMAVLERMPRSASVRAVTDSRLLPIDAPTFDRILKKHPEIGLRIMRSLSARLRDYALQEKRAREIAAGALRGVERREVVLTPVSMTREVQPGGPPGAPVEAAAGPEGGELALVHDATGSTIALPPGDELVVGRPDPASGWRPDVDLGRIDTERSLSRRHVLLRRRGGRLLVEEPARTANGSWHGTERLVEGEPVELRAGDRLRLGLLDFHVERVGG